MVRRSQKQAGYLLDVLLSIGKAARLPGGGARGVREGGGVEEAVVGVKDLGQIGHGVACTTSCYP